MNIFHQIGHFSSNIFFWPFFLLLSFWLQLHICWCNWMALISESLIIEFFFPLQYVLSHYINSMNPLTMPLSISITYCSKFSESPSIIAERMLVFMACPSTVNLLAYHMGKILDVASDKNATNSHYSHIMLSSLQTNNSHNVAYLVWFLVSLLALSVLLSFKVATEKSLLSESPASD